MKLIIGLGNPGKEYDNTRHNIGHKAIDLYAHHLGVEVKKTKKNSLIYKGSDFVLVKPQTYMNLSGDAVMSLMKYFKVNLEDILIIYDDMDLLIGDLKIRKKGSAGGHNGMKDIIFKLDTTEINRLKIGIGRPKYNAKNYVLAPFSKVQVEKLNVLKEPIVKIIEAFIEGGFEKASSIYSQNII